MYMLYFHSHTEEDKQTEGMQLCLHPFLQTYVVLGPTATRGTGTKTFVQFELLRFWWQRTVTELLAYRIYKEFQE